MPTQQENLEEFNTGNDTLDCFCILMAMSKADISLGENQTERIIKSPLIDVRLLHDVWSESSRGNFRDRNGDIIKLPANIQLLMFQRFLIKAEQDYKEQNCPNPTDLDRYHTPSSPHRHRLDCEYNVNDNHELSWLLSSIMFDHEIINNPQTKSISLHAIMSRSQAGDIRFRSENYAVPNKVLCKISERLIRDGVLKTNPYT